CRPSGAHQLPSIESARAVPAPSASNPPHTAPARNACLKSVIMNPPRLHPRARARLRRPAAASQSTGASLSREWRRPAGDDMLRWPRRFSVSQPMPTPSTDRLDPAALARTLVAEHAANAQFRPFAAANGVDGLAAAYRVQEAFVRLMRGDGAAVAGYKIG